jgi:methylenetetrahydrofolate--tRNA-(uracil-5-)-methyltransferase
MRSADTNQKRIMIDNKEIYVIGAGLAGCEAAYYLARHKINVKLYENNKKIID